MVIDTEKLKRLLEARGYTQTALARAAGLSRPALHAILRRKTAAVRRKTLRGLARALRLGDESLLLEDPLAGYKRFVAQTHALLDFRGLALPQADPLDLEDLFVPVRVRASLGRGGGGCGPEEDGRGEEEVGGVREPEEESLTAEERLTEWRLVECLHRHRRIVLRGEPGSGKTTSLRHVARSYATLSQGRAGYPEQHLTPLFVRLADFSKATERAAGLDLVRFVVAQAQCEEQADGSAEVEQLLTEELQHGRCLVLLDGWDEVGDKAEAVSRLGRFVRDHPNNTFVLTSRIVGYEAGPWDRMGFETFDITPWRDEDIRAFAARWCAARHGHPPTRSCKDCARRGAELYEAFVAHPGGRAIATNPLTLTILAALHYANATLPRRRAELYAKVVEVFMETWEAAKRSAPPGDLLHAINLEAREYEWLLGALALEMQRGDRVFGPRWWVTEFVQEFLQRQLGFPGDEAKDQGDRIVRHLCERSGFLVERGPDAFGFSHRTFQEFFASRRVLEEAPAGGQDLIGRLRPYLYHPRWHEVIRLVSAQLPPPQATALLRALLDDADPVGRFLMRGPVLVLHCVADGAAVADRQLIEDVFAAAARLGESKWLGVTIGVLQALRGLAGTRFQLRAEETIATILAGAKIHLEEGEHLTLCLAAGSPTLPDLPPKSSDLVPGRVSEIEVRGCRVRLAALGYELRERDPERWYRAVFKLVRSRSRPAAVRRMFISELAQDVRERQDVHEFLEGLLLTEASPRIRAACATALSRATAVFDSAVKVLLSGLETDKAGEVRWRCAVSLRKVAPRRPDVVARLEEVFRSSGSEDARAGAALGLRKVVPDSPHLRQLFFERAKSRRERPWVRNACLQALQGLLGRDGEVMDCFLRSLDDSCPPQVRRIAALILAEVVADGKTPWVPDMVGRIESLLMAVPNPCPPDLEALFRLAEAQELRAGLRLEGVLRDALRPFDGQIAIAFVYGSVARGAQQHDSDVDLMIIGSVRLKELSGALREAEQVLGRRISPVLYTPASFRQKYQAGNAFLTHVYRNARIFIRGGDDELGELVAERASVEA